MYALGCTLYETLTLRSAYYDNKMGYFPQPVPENFSPQIRQLLDILLTADPVSGVVMQCVLALVMVMR